MSDESKITYVTLFADESIHPKYEEAVERFRAEMGKHYPMYIGGDEVYSENGEFEDRSPIDTSIIVGCFQKGMAEHLKAAIDAAHRTFSDWGMRNCRERVEIMLRAAELMDQRKFEIAASISFEVGKNRLEALAEVWEGVDAIRYYARIIEENNGYAKDLGPGGAGERCSMVAKPYGPWVVISPFNFPFMLANGMCLGALITGNTVVFKPTSEAPLAGLMLYKIYRDAGVPPGAVNFVTGPGDEFEEEATSNSHVAGIAFTGSRDVGMRLYRNFVARQPFPKPVVLEMGSKNPTIVTASADLEKAVEGIVRAAYGYGGQKCSACSRIYIQEDVKERFLKLLVERVKRIPVGDPTKREIFMGPLINMRALQTFEDSVTMAQKDGGTVIYGGRVLKEGEFGKGYYVEPTIILGIPHGHRLFRDELFVPLIVIDAFDTLKEAVRKCNDTEYGLTAGIFSEDQQEIQHFFGNIEFGVVYANRRGGATTGAWPGAQTFVGWKSSGATGRGIGGPHYLLNYLREQSQTAVSE